MEEKKDVETSQKKTHKIWLVVIILIFMLLIFGFGLYLGGKISSDKKTTTNIETGNVKQVELTENGIKNIMDRFKAIKISSDRLYKNDKFDISNVDINEMLVTAFSKHDVYNVCSQSGSDVMLLDEINEELSRYIGKTITMDEIRKIDFVGINNPYDYSYLVKVVDDERLNVKSNVCGGEFDAEDYVFGKIIKGVSEGEYIYIYEKEAFAKYDISSVDDGTYKVNYYKDYNKTGEKIETLNSKDFTDNKGNPYEPYVPNWDLYNTYKYTFKLVDGLYYFQSFELVK